MDWTWIVLAVAVVLFLLHRRRGMVGGEQVAELMARGARVLDVRSRGEYSGGHVEGAVNVPLDQLESKAARTVPAKDVPVLLYCLSGTRSAAAGRTLERLGYTSVHNLGSLSRAKKLISQVK